MSHNTLIDIIDDALATTIKKQSFFQRWAGTIVPIIAALGSALGGYAAAVGADADHAQTAMIVGFMAAVVTGLAARFTKNGNTPTTQRRSLDVIESSLGEIAGMTAGAAVKHVVAVAPSTADYVQALRE